MSPEKLNQAIHALISVVVFAEKEKGDLMKEAIFVADVTLESGVVENWEVIVRRKGESA